MKEKLNHVMDVVRSNPVKVVVITAVAAVGVGLLITAVRNGQLSGMEEAPELIEAAVENL